MPLFPLRTVLRDDPWWYRTRLVPVDQALPSRTMSGTRWCAFRATEPSLCLIKPWWHCSLSEQSSGMSLDGTRQDLYLSTQHCLLWTMSRTRFAFYIIFANFPLSLLPERKSSNFMEVKMIWALFFNEIKFINIFEEKICFTTLYP